MKAILISIQPKWCEKIANGQKTIEVRKTRPNMETPFKCYIYCTTGYRRLVKDTPNGKVIGSGKVIGEFVCYEIIDFANQHLTPLGLSHTCLTLDELNDYLKGKDGFGWTISDLKIYDQPKELGYFSYCAEHDFTKGAIELCDSLGIDCHGSYINRPPHSWCYVEELE